MTRDQRGEPDLPPGPARDIVDLFRQLRHGRPLSGGQIAVRTGLSPGHVSDVLRGWKAPSPRAAAAIAAALGAGQAATGRAARLAEELAELNRHTRRKARPQAAAHQPVTWPRRLGVVPARAQCLQHRPEVDVIVAELTGQAGADDSDPVRTCVLSGLGGTGKTQLAAACAERLLGAGTADLLAWIPAWSRSEIESRFAEAGSEVTGIADQDVSRGAGRFLSWLASTKRRWLIVLDDLTAPADLAGLWPPVLPGGRTIVTTRRTDASLSGPGRKVLAIGPFRPSDATGYLTARLADRPHLLAAADLLAADLEFLPLALAQAAAYLIDRDLTCTDYRTRLADRRTLLADLLPERDALPDEHTETVAATWSLSVDLADQLAPAGLARPLLELAAVLAPDGIPVQVFTAPAALAYLEQAHARPVSAELARDGLHCLARLSLVTIDPGQGASEVRIHALVQRAVADSIAPDRIALTVDAAADALTQAWPAAQRDPGAGRAFLACTDALAAHHSQALWANGAHQVLFDAGRSLGDAAGAGAAAEYFEHLHATALRSLGAGHRDIMTARHELLHWRGEAGDAPGARTGFEELAAELSAAPGPDAQATLTARSELARWSGQAGDAPGAAAQYQALLADRLRILGAEHPDVLTTRGNLAWWTGRAGDVAGAQAGFERLLPDLLAIGGPDHLRTLTVRRDLAYWRGEAGDPAGAAASFKELLDDLIRVHGPDHRDCLDVRSSLAWWRGRAGDPAGAAAAYEELLADRLRLLGPDHRLVLVTRHNLAHWRGEAGDPAGAAAAYEDLLADRLRLLGPHHPHTLNSRSELARWRGEAGDPAAAAAALEELLADRLAIFGPDDPDAVITARNLAGWGGKTARPAPDGRRPRRTAGRPQVHGAGSDPPGR